MSCHHLQSLLQPHQNPDPLHSQLTSLGSIGLPITSFLLYLLSPYGFYKPQSPLFLSFSLAILSQPSMQLPLLSQLTGMSQGSVFGLTFQDSSLCLMAFFFFPFALCTHSILIPQPGIQTVFPEVGACSSNHWTAREFPVLWQGYR